MVISRHPAPSRPASPLFTTVVLVPELPDPPLLSRSNAPARDSRRWTVQLRQRMLRYLWLKAIGISLFMWVFFIAYFQLLRNPVYPVTQMPLTALDLAIPFQPGTVVAYLSLWLYVGIPPGLLLSFRQLLVYGLWAAALCLTGLACFYWFPTAVPPLALDPDLARFPAFALLQGVDATGNACPSLHVATAAFTALWVEHVLRSIGTPLWLRACNGLWVGAIVWSTMATKQHVAWDVAAGLLLAMVFAALSLLATRRGALASAG